MLRHSVVLALVLLSKEAAAQDPASRDSVSRGGGFGAPVVKYSVVRNQSAVMFGGRGGWYVTPALSLGGGLYGTLSEIDAPNGVTTADGQPLDIKFESFGFELEYARHPGATGHLILGAFLGGGAARYVRDGTDSQDGETDFMFLLEPSVGFERRLARRAWLNLAVSYRLVSGVNQRGLSAGDFNGPAAVVGVKF